MKKNYLFLASCFLFLASASGQITFQKTFGGTGADRGYSVKQTADGGYVIAGYTNSFGAGGNDVYLIKTDANGDTLWTKTYGGISDDWGSSVQQTTDGGYIITGYTDSYGAGYYDVYLIKTSATGTTLWTKTYGGASDDWGSSAQQTSDGGYVVVGYTYSFGTGQDVYLIKTDATGATVWTKTYGGTNADWGSSVQQTADGGYIIVGWTNSFGAGDNDVYLIKTSATGATVWTKTFGGISDDRGSSVQQTADGGYIIAGLANSFGSGAADVYLIKTSATGNSLWTKTFGNVYQDDGFSVQQIADGGYIIAGNSQGGNYAVYLIKTDATGNNLWTNNFGGGNGDYGNSVQQTADGGYIIAGWTHSFGAGDLDVYLIKTDANGNSGCNGGSAATIVGTTATIDTTPATIVTSSATVVTTPATVVGSGSAITTLCTTVGIQSAINNPQTAISVSPNPSGGKFTVEMNGMQNQLGISIYDMIGEKVFEQKIVSNRTEINLSNQPAGIYFVQMRNDNQSFTQKLIIQK